MLQRIQTLYLLAAAVLSVVCLCLQIGTFGADGALVADEYNLWLMDGAGGYRFSTWPLFVVLLLSAAVGIYTIFMYSNRRVQARFCAFCMLLVCGWYVLYVVYGQVCLPDVEQASFYPAWPAVLPGLSLVFYFMARRAIMADERLVRAADRIR